MPNLDMELDHLRQADEHIALARVNVADVSEAVATTASPTVEMAEHLITLKSTLAAFEAHRELILQTISGIRDGSLPST